MEKNKIYTLSNFKGLNVSTYPTQIDENESPDMCNFELDVKGTLRKRYGYEKLFDSLGDTPINGMYVYTNKDMVSVEIFAHNNKLYKLEGNKAIELYVGLADNKVKFFTMKNKCYIMDGKNYLEFDGKEVKEPTPYIPEMFRNGTALEDFNLLGTRFKSTFSPDGTEKEFTLGVKPLNDEEVKVSHNGGIDWKTTGFTVDKEEGKVTFTEPPANGEGTLVIEAGTDNKDKKKFITNCTIRSFFGGTNDTRALLSGNPEFPNRVYRTGLYDPTYFPENGYTDVGSDTERVMNFAKQYDSLVVIKERSLYLMAYDTSNLVFTTKPINEQSGTCAGSSVQVVNNAPVWLDRYKGIVALKQSNIRDERNIEVISEKINPLLLKEPDIENAISLDYLNKYYLFINGKAYIYDSDRKIWYLFDNINANCFLIKDTLYFGDMKGCIQRFKNEKDKYPYNDNGEPINAYWYSKLLNFGVDYREKTVRKMYYSILPYEKSSITLSIISNADKEKVAAYERVDLQNYEPFYYEPFSYISNSFPLSDGIKSKLKKIVYMQVKIENNRVDESLDLISLSFDVLLARFRK